jgi:hypothetical protein
VADVRAFRLIALGFVLVALAACGGPASADRSSAPVTQQSSGQIPAKVGNVASSPDRYPVSTTQVGSLGVPVDLSLETGNFSRPPGTIVTTVQITLDAIIPSAVPLTGCSQFQCGAPPSETGAGEWRAFKFSLVNLCACAVEDYRYTPGLEFDVISTPRAMLISAGFVGCPALMFDLLRARSTASGCVAIWVPAGRAAPRTVLVKLSIGGVDATDPSVRWQV